MVFFLALYGKIYSSDFSVLRIIRNPRPFSPVRLRPQKLPFLWGRLTGKGEPNTVIFNFVLSPAKELETPPELRFAFN